MLKILVCVKQVPDIDLVKMDPETGNLVRDGVPSMMNPLDMNALEAALRLKENMGGEITAITMGPPAAEAVLRECLALGADRAVLVTGREFGGADTLSTSYVIAKAALQLGNYDLIFCGKETLDGATGQMGSQLAERFGSSQVTSMSLIKSVDIENGKIVVEREVENGVETIEAQMPCLFTVDKTNYPPRLPNYRGKKAARKAEIITLGPGDIEGLDPKLIGVPGSGTIVPRIYPPVLPEAGQIIDEGSAAASAAKLCAILAAEGRI
mgnify:FL=1